MVRLLNENFRNITDELTIANFANNTIYINSADNSNNASGNLDLVIGDDTNKLWLNNTNDGVLALGGTTKATAPFRVTAAGALTATSATISGNITATTGNIGGWDISSVAIYKDNGLTSAGLAPADYPFYAGNTYTNRATAPFRVTPDGTVVAKEIITGTLQIAVSPGESIQDRIDEVYAAGGGIVAVRNGLYTLTDNITIPSGVYVRGETATGVILDFVDNTHGVRMEGDNAYSAGTVSINPGETVVTGVGTEWDTYAAVGQKILLGESWFTITAVNGDTELEIEVPYSWSALSGASYVLATVNADSYLEIMTIMNADYGVYLRYTENGFLNTLTFVACGVGVEHHDSANHSIQVVQTYACNYGFILDNVHLVEFSTPGAQSSLAGDGVYLTNCSNFSVDKLYASGNANNGITADYCQNFQINGTFLNNVSTGISLTGSAGGVISESALENNGGYGMYISADSSEIMISNNSFDSNVLGELNNLATDTLISPNVGLGTMALNNILPDQGGNSGKYLKTNGTEVSWDVQTTGLTNLDTYATGDLPSPGTPTTAKSPTSETDGGGGWGDGSSGALVVTNGQTVNLSLNTKHQFTSIDVQAGGVLSTTSSSGAVMYLLCQGNCHIDGSVLLNGKVAYGQSASSVTLDGTTYNSPSCANGGAGGSTEASGGTQGSGFGGGGAGGAATAYIGSWALGGAGGAGGWPAGSGGAGRGVLGGPATYNGNAGGTSSGGSGGNSNSGPTSDTQVQSGGNAYGGSASSSTASGAKCAAGGSGGAGGIAGIPGVNLVIKARTIDIGGTLNVSGTAGGNGGAGGARAYTSDASCSGGAGGGGGGGGNAGAVTLCYTESITGIATITKTGGAAGSGGAGGSGSSGGSNGSAGSAGAATTETQYSFTNPTNIYSSNDTYATCTPDSGVMTIAISTDAGATWSESKSNTYDGTEGAQAYGGLTDDWGLTLTGADIKSSNFLVRIACGTNTIYQHAFGGFDFSALADGDTVLGLSISLEAKYTGGTASLDHLTVIANMTDAGETIVEGSIAYDSTLNLITANDGTNWNNVALQVYPVGAIYISVDSTSPADLFGGTWVAFGAGKVLVGLNGSDTDFDTVEETGGHKSLASHRHTIEVYSGGAGIPEWKYPDTSSTGGLDYAVPVDSNTMYSRGFTDYYGAGNAGNLQPYIVVYMWKRTA